MTEFNLTLNEIGRAGLADPAGQALIGSDTAKFVNDGNVVLRVANAGGGTFVTMITPARDLGDGVMAISDQTISIPAGETRWLGPFNPNHYTDTDGKALLDPTGAVTVTAFRLPE